MKSFKRPEQHQKKTKIRKLKKNGKETQKTLHMKSFTKLEQHQKKISEPSTYKAISLTAQMAFPIMSWRETVIF